MSLKIYFSFVFFSFLIIHFFLNYTMVHEKYRLLSKTMPISTHITQFLVEIRFRFGLLVYQVQVWFGSVSG